ncbi:cupin domain-containing protein [Janibacter cremeus]|uniref:Quercetin dioxygenase-like cupin family protein n=1 Tax=Janibacter cremeus TaxID=1285192 RepID=A0A852VUU8_9MICO|nr:cupin domain-containing protein [Janibacter cremeus]NYF98054.1 quercetin dioxygenase-like cupin family protein [Janibacter cremeus]
MTQQADPRPTEMIQPGVDLEALIDSCVASRETRHEDWDALGFQADAKGEQFRRAQIRYVGSGATGNFDTDSRIIPAGGFTFSNMRLPAGAAGPEHTHNDVEEAFFVLEGEIEVSVHDVEDGTKKATRALGYRDIVVVPAGVPRSLVNNTDKDALFCVIIGTQKPQLPVYPETSVMHGVTR